MTKIVSLEMDVDPARDRPEDRYDLVGGSFGGYLKVKLEGGEEFRTLFGTDSVEVLLEAAADAEHRERREKINDHYYVSGNLVDIREDDAIKPRAKQLLTIRMFI